MRTKMKRCAQCGAYAFPAVCPRCGGTMVNPVPARYSPLDPYGKYRRLARTR